MSKSTTTNYNCDKCNKALPTWDNHVVIITELASSGNLWKRLRVTIQYHSGIHNEGTLQDADLCKSCTIELLEDALNRIKKGERVSAGVNSIKKLNFNQVF